MIEMINMIILLAVFRMLSLNEAFDFTCPPQAHWGIRAKSMCKPPSNYTCLFDVNYQINVYKDKCSRPSIVGPGYKYVFQPNLNRAECNVIRYQPFIFETIGYSDCTFKKSHCNSLGQETYDNGDTRSDTTCICNTDRGYTFVGNLKNQCYCDPSTDDCSCYLGLNPYNSTVGLKDIKCYEGMKMTKSPYLGDMFNMSRAIKIVEFNNNNYNLNHLPTNDYRTEASKWVLIMSLAKIIVCIILLIYRRRLQRCLQIPNKAMHHFLEQDKIRFNKLLETEKTENRYFVRIMIVGKESAGKTCLLRRLLKEKISSVTSTDGVDIVVRRCKININDGQWTIGKDVGDDEDCRIKRSLSPNAEDRYTENMQVDETNDLNTSQNNEMPTNQDEITTEAQVRQDKSKVKNESSPLTTPENFTTDANDTNDSSSLVKHGDSTTHTKENIYENKDKKKPLVMTEDLISHVFSKSTVNTPSNLHALCELWDFAGQKEFYATHQAFLTSSAVYLVVADMKDNISKQELNQCFADFPNVGEYVEFWFDSIHCHRNCDERATNGYFCPPILLVFTGKDRYDKGEFENRQKELTKQIDEAFGLKSKYHHLHKTFYLSNLSKTDEEFEKLRYEIYKTAKKMDNWGKPFPLKWILLEHLIEINKNDQQNFVNFTEMSKLAKHSDINILNEDDLLLFLRFQHIAGNIIFFENIRDLIILNPQWLADAFRCLVSDRFDNSSLYHREDWTLFIRQGKISESLITELFKAKDGSQFLGQTHNLYAVMEKLDILVKIENSNYIMPSMIPAATIKDVCEKFGILTEKCKRTSWLCFKFDFLPPSFFNHLSAWFLRKYDPSKVDNTSALYRGICMFDIDGSGCKKILVTMSTDKIALQVLSFSEQEGFGSTCSDIYSEVTQLIEDIKEKYQVKIAFKTHFKCSDGDTNKDTFEYDTLTKNQECYCPQHQTAHRSEQIYSLWVNTEVKRTSDDRAEIRTIQVDIHPKNISTTEEVVYQRSIRNNFPVSINLRQQLDIQTSANQLFHSCIKLGNILVIANFTTRQLVICNVNGTGIRHISLSLYPQYITEVDSNTVAVACTDNEIPVACTDNEIPVASTEICLINMSTRSVTTIATSGKCYGISYNDNNLYAVIDRKKIHVMDLTGKVVRTIPAPSDDIFDITVDRHRLVCIDSSSIYQCSLDGELLWKFKNDSYQLLHRVTTDAEGNVYATEYNTETVVAVSVDGNQFKELITNSDGLNKPFAIYFEKKDNVLVVFNHLDGKGFLFDANNEQN